MKQSIRLKTFETNSSSTHSFTLSNHDEIIDIIYDVKTLLEESDGIDDIYKALAKLKIAEHLLIENIYTKGN